MDGRTIVQVGRWRNDLVKSAVVPRVEDNDFDKTVEQIRGVEKAKVPGCLKGFRRAVRKCAALTEELVPKFVVLQTVLTIREALVSAFGATVCASRRQHGLRKALAFEANDASVFEWLGR